MMKVLDCVLHEHDLGLVAVSALICLLGCCATTTLLARARESGRPRLRRWIVAAAAVFGSSVWSLHFVAMLAFMPGQQMAYHVGLTGLSALVAFSGALGAFAVRSPAGASLARSAAGGILLGAGICGMHYLGVAAMSFSGFLLFDGRYVAASVLISVALATSAMVGASDLGTRTRRFTVTGCLVLAICGLHYTGMAAMTMAPGSPELGGGTVLGTSALAIAVGGVSALILLAGLTAMTIEAHLSRRTSQELCRMRLMSNFAQEVLIIHREGTILEVNQAGERLFRATAQHLVGRPVLSLFAEESLPALIRRQQCPPLARRPEEIEVRVVGGVNLTVEISCQPIDYLGRSATVLAMRDLTDRKRDEAQIRHLARHDALTGLPNRYDLEARIDLALGTAARERSVFAVASIDLDRFKPVNDLHGRAAGDALLIEVARRILAEIRPVDTLARIGSDEFVVLLAQGVRLDGVSSTAVSVLDALRRPFTIEDKRVEIGASIGVALYPQDAATADGLLRAADAAMYRVKEEGRGAVHFFEAAMNARLQARLQLEQELAGAVQREELFLHYQPMVNGVSGEVETFEALIRWSHPTRGAISPADFIPIAEETGLIAGIGRWVIETSCREAASWPSPWRVSVNVSPKQFLRSDICEILAGALRANDLPPSRVVVEVTEGVLIDDAAKAVATLNRLRELGVRIALDDFGTGFSSLSYLQMFKFDKLKIDQSFVKRLVDNDDALTLTRTIVNLGHNLGLDVTAEGVETTQQLAILRWLGCDQIQGYLVARPAPVRSFTEVDRLRTMALFKDQVEALCGAERRPRREERDRSSGLRRSVR